MADCRDGTDCGPAAQLGRAADRCEVHHEHKSDKDAHEHDHDHDGHDHDGHDHAAHAHHHHGHGHSHGHGRESDRKRLLIALGISGAILVAEVVGGLLAHSLALLSDAGHVLTDMSAQILSLFALILASRPADAKRTYGYYRLEILAALANGAILIGLAAVIIVSAIRRLGDPTTVDAGIMIPVAIAGLVANAAGAWLLHGASTLNVRGAYLHILSDLLSLVAVLIGGVVMALNPRLTIIDPILGIAIGLIVVVGAFRLLREAVDVLLEAVPGEIDAEKVRADVRQLSGIEDVHDLHIWTITSGLHALSAHIVVAEGAVMKSNDELLTRVKELLLRQHRIAHSTLQIESPEYEHVGHVH